MRNSFQDGATCAREPAFLDRKIAEALKEVNGAFVCMISKTALQTIYFRGPDFDAAVDSCSRVFITRLSVPEHLSA